MVILAIILLRAEKTSLVNDRDAEYMCNVRRARMFLCVWRGLNFNLLSLYSYLPTPTPLSLLTKRKTKTHKPKNSHTHLHVCL